LEEKGPLEDEKTPILSNMSKSWGWEPKKIQLPLTNKRSEMEEDVRVGVGP
jgi:hypothetical protein